MAKIKFTLKLSLIVIILAAIGVGAAVYSVHKSPGSKSSQTKSSKSSTTTAQAPPAVNYCANNASGQEIVVSISKQHMWACNGTKSAYDNAVITGMEQYPADLTPPGTYQVYAKATNQELAGSDNTGSWDDHVSYWMPFLSNNYGVYGFHDATWRADSDFGKININAPFTTTAASASHGCVEMPLTAAKWFYDWAPVGTTVLVQS